MSRDDNPSRSDASASLDLGALYTAHAAFTIAQGVGDNVVVDVPVPAALIVDGLNYVAVMVKQDDGVSSDLSFDLELRVTAP